MDAESSALRLPPRLDTLGALSLAGALQRRGRGDAPLALDGGGVTEIGIVAAQLLWALRLRDGGTTLTGLDPAIAAGLRAVGLGGVLGDAPAPASVPANATALRFGAAALRFGGEPLLTLRSLAAMGAAPVAALAPADAAKVPAQPDQLRLVFTLAPGVDRAAVDALLDGQDVEWLAIGDPATPSDPMPTTAGATTGATAAAGPVAATAPPRADLVPVVRLRLEALAAQSYEMAGIQEKLMACVEAGRSCTIERAEFEEAMGALQQAIAALTTAPLDTLVEALAPCPGLTVTDGDTEIDRATFDLIAPALRALAEGAGEASLAIRDEGLANRIDVTLARPAPAAADALRAVVRRVGGRSAAAADGRALTATLPVPLALTDALVVHVGAASYAIPTSQMVEALRPVPAMLHGPGLARPLLRFRDRYVPVVPLGERFGIEGWERDPLAAIVVVVRARDGFAALQVDAIGDQRRLTVKPLGGGIALPEGIAGIALRSGDGSALVLDLPALFAD